MKFSVQLALACFSVGVLSNATPRHPTTTIQNVIGECQTGVDNLDTECKAYDGGDTSLLQKTATTLVDIIVRGNTEIAVQPSLSLSATLELTTTVTTFIDHVKILTETLKAKRDVVKAALKCGLVRENIDVINTAAGTFIGTVVGKCNPLAQEVAKQKAQILQALLNGCKEDYSTVNCP
ncbi:hypothetical protein CRV24_005193 [Beauveria bassiana]|uniref:Cell wall protein n=1 Tax=Beauveria bassiana (strain ARSEF 2860) TaxID=655819 RepID=J5JF31_BEAB2|nr:uncharacterized protein BBA_08793 [Beauveria bassiana ARSEF 2860]EJP62251.1 hypothetical protein BBA_08793 [Beauveria bassiana ARSEF 2860]KAF1733665.1 hypothetical protein CRV24_005193 [Beauveria bassiana]KAH8709877.1 hypothetical protein HC256_009784 [Beauveria bassiana]